MSTSVTARTASAQNAFRDMTWLHQERARVYAVGMAIVWTVLLFKIIWSLQDGHDSAGDLFGGDYSSFWAASRLVLAGWPADAYVRTIHHLAELPVLTKGYAAFYYPPPYLLLCTPLALLSFFPSLAVFLCATGAVFVGTIRRILKTSWTATATLAFPAVVLNIIPGQNAFLTAAILGSGLTILDRRPKLAGAILGLMVIKPHLALAVPIALIISRRWPVLICAAATALSLLALSYVMFGWEVWAAFLANAHNSGEAMEQGLVGFTKMQSAFALARWLGASIPIAYLIQGSLVVAAVCCLSRGRHLRVTPSTEKALIVLASLAMTPFLLQYDMVLMALPLAWMLREWSETGFPPWAKLVMIAAFCTPIAYVLFAPISFGMPMVIIFGAYVLWSASSSRAGVLLQWHRVRLTTTK
jgi:hypothetical protein